MKWIINFFTSSLGRKLIMSLTGLFLILFLIVHLTANLKLLANDAGKSFTEFTIFMEENPFIQIVAWGLYLFILLHAIQGTIIAVINRRTKGKGYAVTTRENANWASKNMFFLGVLLFVFLVIHMGDWWLEMKVLGNYNEEALYQNVVDTFKMPLYVVIYELAMIALFFHLRHGFQSAFQTLGLNHPKYTPIIKGLGWIYSILVPLGFFLIPIVIYFFK